jgi:hypothetical protein
MTFIDDSSDGVSRQFHPWGKMLICFGRVAGTLLGMNTIGRSLNRSRGAGGCIFEEADLLQI